MKSFLTTFLLSAGPCSATLPEGAAEEARLVDEPYGVCCHVTRGELWDAPKLYPLMREAGVSMVRSDWDWRYQEDAPGKFNPKYDLLIENIFRGGMDFLPILPGNQPKFGQWAWNHLDDFGRFVRRDIGRARNHFESHFGLLDRDNRPKFAYQALKTLTRLLPGGSTVPRISMRNDVCLATWDPAGPYAGLGALERVQPAGGGSGHPQDRRGRHRRDESSRRNASRSELRRKSDGHRLDPLSRRPGKCHVLRRVTGVSLSNPGVKRSHCGRL